MHTLDGEFCGTPRGGFSLGHDPVAVSINSMVQGLDYRKKCASGQNGFTDFPSNDPQARFNQSPLLVTSSEGDSPEEADESDVLLKYISQILLEEDLEGKTCMLQDGLALQALEKSFYDALCEKYPHSQNQLPSSSNHEVANSGSSTVTSSSISTSIKGCGAVNLDESNRVHVENPFLMRSQSDSCSPCSGCDTVDSVADSPVSILPATSSFGDSEFVKKSGREIKEVNQFLSHGDHVLVNLDHDISISRESDKGSVEAVVMIKNDGTRYSSNWSRGRKNHEREERDYLEEERSNKHSATYSEEPEQLDLFDKVLLCPGTNEESVSCNTDEASIREEANRKVQPNEQRGRRSRSKKGKSKSNKQEVVDLTTLLTNCAQSVASYDQRTAWEQLKQIRQHSSRFGDGSQRLAHCFANGLEARLVGTGGEMHAGSTFAANRTPASDILKAYNVFISSCPFKKVSNMLANRTIIKLAGKATRLHIIDFGILYGFQWPCLIQRLSERPGGPPKLRITGIEFPQPGFRPAERVEETGRRLADYCERFNVPFEYCAIAQKWETIRLEDIKIDRDELLIVNCLYRFRNLLDETVIANSPRDAVLNLVKKFNPDYFIHGVVNGTYNAPFFMTRFREALFHYSALFDMFEACIPREDEARMLFETEIFGKEAMNVIACEGSERVERPETYKQWQVRNLRAGFKQIPFSQEILQQVRTKVKSGYHKDFMVDENGKWMLQGWKGRIIYALSCWVPA